MVRTETERPSDQSTWDFVPGDEITPGLHALSLLGGGERYEAYLAFDDRLHYRVVAKVLRPDKVRERSALRGLRREAAILRRVEHPVVIRAFGGDTHGARPHLILELAEGPRLSSDLRRYGRLDVEQAAPLGVELSAALHAMHLDGLVHLDVKPKNVILGAPPRLIDLSIARTIEEAARLDRPVGTDAYMAPEQCAPGRAGLVGPASDVWSVGVTLFEAATGELPFRRSPDGDRDTDDASEAGRFPQLEAPPAVLPRTVAPELAEAIEASLRFDASARPAPREVADMIEPLLRTTPRFVLKALRPR